MTRDELAELLEIARARGDAELEKQVTAALEAAPAVYEREDAGTLGDILGAAEVGGAVVSGIVAEPVAGLAGLGGLAAEGAQNILRGLGLEKAAQFMEPGDLAALVSNTRQRLTFEPNTQEGQAQLAALGEFLSPLARGMERVTQASGDVGYRIGSEFGQPAITGAAFATIPTAILEFVSLKAPSAAGAVARSRSRVMDREIAAAQQAIDDLNIDTVQQGAQLIQRGNIADVGEMVRANPDIVRAFEDMEVPYLAGYVSESPIYRDIEGGLTAFKGSPLKETQEQVAKRVAEVADGLIVKYDGTRDKSLLSQRFRDDQLSVINELFRQADDLYDEVGENIDRTQRVMPASTLAHIDRVIAELGGKVPRYLKEARKELQFSTRTTIGPDGLQREVADQSTLPTYGRLDQLRKEVGQSLRKKSGRSAFTEAEEGALRHLYGHLRRDQDLLTETISDADTLRKLKEADQLTVQRKLLEDQTIDLLGKDLAGSITMKAGSKLISATKGDILKWKEFVRNVPESYRQQVVATSLNDLFRGSGLGQGAVGVNRFAKFYDELNAQPTLKEAIYSELPPGAGKDIDNLGTIAKGIARANQSVKETGVITSLFDDNATLMNRLMTGVTRMQVGGNMASASIIKDFLTAKTPQKVAVSQLLDDEKFRSLITQAVTDGVVAGSTKSRKLKKLEKQIEQSEKFRNWAQTLPNNRYAELLSLGLVNYLFTQKDQ